VNTDFTDLVRNEKDPPWRIPPKTIKIDELRKDIKNGYIDFSKFFKDRVEDLVDNG
jgi:hypothetical protein